MKNFIKDWEFLLYNAVSCVLPELPKLYITFTKFKNQVTPNFIELGTKKCTFQFSSFLVISAKDLLWLRKKHERDNKVPIRLNKF